MCAFFILIFGSLNHFIFGPVRRKITTYDCVRYSDKGEKQYRGTHHRSNKILLLATDEISFLRANRKLPIRIRCSCAVGITKQKLRHNVNVNIGRFRKCGKEAVVRRVPLSATCPIRFIVIDSVHGVHLDRCNM